MVALLCWPFELFPLNELYRGKACALNNSYPLRYFDDIWYTSISSQEDVSCANMVAPLAALLSYLP